jgi:hypothetical protein
MWNRRKGTEMGEGEGKIVSNGRHNYDKNIKKCIWLLELVS